MCGILGIVSLPGQRAAIDRADILAMRERMRARGPDDAGLFERNNVILAHRRLAIRDLAGGKQPWLSADGQCALVYNGEVYNDDELRNELRLRGHEFRSRCDTEVVMEAYRAWGPGCVTRLRGMFAFGIYDFQHDRLLLARDRFGIKPLFLTQIDGRLIFASSISALLRHPQMTRQPHLPAVSHYLSTFRITLGRETVYSGIWQLLPGECLEWRAGHVHIEPYWSLPGDEHDSLTYDESVTELQDRLTDAVRVRLASDVPVGMFLSGGLDSNTIACLLRETSSNVTVARCGGGSAAESGELDEFDDARRVARHVGFDYDETRVDADDYWQSWLWMLEQYATPVSTPTDVILYRLSQQMQRSVGVVLGGEGADELLCGYAVTHWSGRDYETFQRIDAGHWPGGPAAARLFRQSLQKQYGCVQFASESDHFLALNSLIHPAVKPRLFQPGAWKQAEEDRRLWSHYQMLFDAFKDRGVLNRYAAVVHRVNLEGQLARLDAASMLAGLEARVPYTDHLLVETMYRVPLEHKIAVAGNEQAPFLASGELDRRGSLRSKRILRSLGERLMPASLSGRTKRSFPTPVRSWISGAWQERIRDLLLDSPFARTLFQPEPLRELCDHLPQAGMWIWPLINVAAWGDREFADRSPA